MLFGQQVALEKIKAYPFPENLTASATGSKIAWTINAEGKRNVYVAEGPEFTARKLTSYDEDDGQELSSVSISADGKWVVYERGGDHGSNWNDDGIVNPTFSPTPLKVQIWSVPFGGGKPILLGDGHGPVISPKSDRIVYEKGNQPWIAPLDGASESKLLFNARGSNGEFEWSPSGDQLAFVSTRGDHSFIGVFTNSETPIQWIAPSFFRDRSPRWSPDGKQLSFIRLNGRGGAPEPVLERRHQPWSIWTADVAAGKTAQRWTAPKTLRGSVPGTQGGTNLHWAANNRIVFLSYQDGQPHLYSMDAKGGEPLLLTPGPFMAEYISISADKKWMIFCGNTGPDKLDIDRRHIIRVSVDKANMEVLTPGNGNEWTPVITGDGKHIAMISATAQRPPVVAVQPFEKGKMKLL